MSVNIEQLREALEANIYRDDLPPVEIVARCVNVVRLHTRKMADEIEQLRSEVEDLETPPHNAMQIENETAMMHDEIVALKSENMRLLSALEIIASGKLPHYQNQSVAHKTLQGAGYREEIGDEIK